MNASHSLQVPEWEVELKRWLPLLGHRNWIVIADSAYPAQSSAGIETIVTGAEHLDVLDKTLDAIAGCRHIRATAYVDAELNAITDEDAPGVSAYRQGLARALDGAPTLELPHEQIISKVDERAKLFRILILKSTLGIPYTSVFLELDCGYWDALAERRLRESLAIRCTPPSSGNLASTTDPSECDGAK